MIQKKDDNVEVIFKEGYAEVIVGNRSAGKVAFQENSCHNMHCYLKLELDFEMFEGMDANTVFEELKSEIKRPLQVMISSDEKDAIYFWGKAGFVRKRRCYEVEAQKEDCIGKDVEVFELCVAREGERIYETCCNRMLERYILTHRAISPWTGTAEEFYANLPDEVIYNVTDGEVVNFAFVEDNEIAYVCGNDVKVFRIFAEALLTKMFNAYEIVTFEADDCDEYAMELKFLFINQPTDSYDTFVL